MRIAARLAIVALFVLPLAFAPATAKEWTPPRTTWGDPDLQGTYTNNNEYAMPLERPAEFAGKRAQDLTPAEIADVRRQAQQRMVDALPGGRVRGPDDWWLQNLDLSKRSRVWSIVDPPCGAWGRSAGSTIEHQRRSFGVSPQKRLGGPAGASGRTVLARQG